MTLEPGRDRVPPIAIATLFGSQPLRFERTFELSLQDGVFTVERERDAPTPSPPPSRPPG